MSGTPAEAVRFGELRARYEWLGVLARSWTSEVHSAWDHEAGRLVAVKVLRPEHARDPEARARAERERQLLERLRHECLVQLHAAVELPDGSPALVLEYVQGPSLRDLLGRRMELGFGQVRQVLHDIGSALGYLHAHGLVHRDVTPANIRLRRDDGRAVLIDLGITRAASIPPDITLPGVLLGTPAYMSPEQVAGEEVDARSDLYSLGLVAYAALLGRPPWEGGDLFSVLYRQRHEALPPIERMRPSTPRDLQAAVASLLQRDHEARCASAGKLIAMLLPPPVRGGTAETAAAGDAQAAADGETAGAAAQSGVAESGTATGNDAIAESGAIVETGIALISAVTAEIDAARAGAVSAAAAMRAAGRRRRGVGWGVVAAAAVLVLAGTGGVALVARHPERPGEPAAEPAAAPAPAPPAGVGTVPVAARIELVGGDAQSGPAGSRLAAPVQVRVVDAGGGPVADAFVVFAPADGSGLFQPGIAQSDSAGIARSLWLLGPRAGEQRGVVRASALPDSPITVRAAARPGPPQRLEVRRGNGQRAGAGERLSDSLEVRVTDGLGNPLAGIRVAFEVVSGSGSVSPATVTTDREGTARAAWRLGPREGPQSVRARLPVRGIEPVLWVATAEPAAPPPASSSPAVAAGGEHSCALGANGRVRCWGSNDGGQLGSGGAAPGAATAGGTAFRSVTAGAAHTCGIGTDGATYCWGENGRGQLGTGDLRRRSAPARIAGDPGFAIVRAGAAHSCGITDAGALYCWGSNSDAQLGDATTTDRLRPTRVASNATFRALAPGWTHTCALAAGGAVLCWGNNAAGQLGFPGGTRSARPARVAVTGGYIAVAAGRAHSCALSAIGDIHCWGQNVYGQLGDGSRADRVAPVRVRANEPFRAITAGAWHSCGLSADGAAYCWGRNSQGQLGDGTTLDRTTPGPVAGGLRFRSIEANGEHTCGVAADGAHYCWGDNRAGQLGDGTRRSRTRPVRAGG